MHAPEPRHSIPHAFPPRLQRYSKRSVLGSGSFGAVLAAVDQTTHERVAVKIMANDAKYGCEATSIREAAALQALQGHPNIVALRDVWFAEQYTYVVMEMCDATLFDVIKAASRHREALPVERQKKYGREILEGLAHCHAMDIAHRDLKTANVLVHHASDTLKLCDFGLARTAEHPAKATTRDVVTLPYRAPEVLLQTRPYVGVELDLWSAGVILYELSACRLPFEGVTEVCILMQMFKRKGTPTDPATTALPLFAGQPWPRFPEPAGWGWIPPHVPAPAARLIDSLLHYNPAARPTAETAAADEWFRGGEGGSHLGPACEMSLADKGSPIGI
eukprot:TRINITY_DN2869_c0_g3_i1.p1 TRINITY_DN2869_c0_g3~~TRINITY_DN2869_c0_g3_i1.p1  ORF type:complete len:333 (+),score=89.10 TRINITY_DN2869_c0_g3_i1:55-1053(+)